MLNKTYWKASNAYTNGLLLPTQKNVYQNAAIIPGQPIDKSIATSWYKTKFSTLSRNDRSQTTKHTIEEYNVFSVFSTLNGNATVAYNYMDTGLRSSGSGWDVTRFICGIDTSVINLFVPVILYSSTKPTRTVNAINFINNFKDFKDYDYAILGRPVSNSQYGATEFSLHFIIENEKYGAILQFSGIDNFTSVSSHQWIGGNICQPNFTGSNTATYRYAESVQLTVKDATYPHVFIMPYASEEIEDNKDINAYAQFLTSFEKYVVVESYSGVERAAWSPDVIYELIRHIGIPLRDTNAVTSATQVYIPLVDENGYHSGEWVLSTDKKAKESSLYKAQTDQNTIDPTKPPQPGPSDDEQPEYGGTAWAGNETVSIDTGIAYREMTSNQINDFRSVIEVLKAYDMSYKKYLTNAAAAGIIESIAVDKWKEMFPSVADYSAFIYDKYGYGSDPVNSIISITAFPFNIPTVTNLPIKDIGAVDLYIAIPTGYTPSGTVEFANINYYTADGEYGTVHSYPVITNDAFTINLVDTYITHPKDYTDFRAYSPYTRLELYIPMHGTIDLDPAVVIGQKLTVKISVTVSDGSSVAIVLINDSIYQTINGQVGYSIPLSANASSTNNLALKTLSAQNQSQRLNAIGNIIHGLGSAAGSIAAGNYGSAIGSTIDTVLSGQQNAINSSAIKYQIEHATDGKIVVGQPSSLNAFTMHKKCQLIWHLPLMQGYDPTIYGKTVGYKCHKTTTLGALTGYTECSNAILDNVSCTEAEKAIILEQLKNGIII